jgi:hypothetical protein
MQANQAAPPKIPSHINRTRLTNGSLVGIGRAAYALSSISLEAVTLHNPTQAVVRYMNQLPTKFRIVRDRPILP